MFLKIHFDTKHDAIFNCDAQCFFWSRAVSRLFKQRWKNCSYQRQHHCLLKWTPLTSKTTPYEQYISVMGQKNSGGSKVSEEQLRRARGRYLTLSRFTEETQPKAQARTKGSNRHSMGTEMCMLCPSKLWSPNLSIHPFSKLRICCRVTWMMLGPIPVSRAKSGEHPGQIKIVNRSKMFMLLAYSQLLNHYQLLHTIDHTMACMLVNMTLLSPDTNPVILLLICASKPLPCCLPQVLFYIKDRYQIQNSWIEKAHYLKYFF